MTAENVPNISRVTRTARLKWVPIALMRVSRLGQRELRPARVDKLAANMDLDRIGNPVVSWRDGFYWIIDGQHRIEALKAIGFGDLDVQCWTHEGLTEEQEAAESLGLNDVLAMDVYSKFCIGVTAGLPVPCDVDRIVRAQGLHISKAKSEGAIGCVGTLTKVYERDGAGILARAIGIIRDSFGHSGFEAPVIDGMGLFCARYTDRIDAAHLVSRLHNLSGGMHGLLGKARVIRNQTGKQHSLCVAAAITDVYNAGRGGGKKVPNWWAATA